MEDHGILLNKKCPCTQKECPIRGNCVICIQNHLVNKRHVPECIQNMLREPIKELAKKMELSFSESRPDKIFWEEFDKEKFLRESLEKHE
ncbi:MAG: hypothetical protein GY774_37360 [Planctomycetes bacterium]|nr:hypothetical protein [Planctomycetota bacterium]